MKTLKHPVIIFFIFILIVTSLVTITNALATSSVYKGTPSTKISATPNVFYTTFDAPSLNSSLIRNDTTQPYFAILPSSYNSSNNSYPVIYFLHGYGVTLNKDSSFWQQFPTDEYLGESIVVLGPGSHSLFQCANYVNSPITGNWEDFIVYDLVNYTDTHFRTIPDRNFRGIAGHSVGGYGALHIAMKHPDVFGAVHAICPALFDKEGLLNSQFCTENVISNFLDVQDTLNALPNDTIAHTEYITWLKNNWYVDPGGRFWPFPYGSAFSPNPDKRAPYIDFHYYKHENGSILRDEEHWLNWEKGFGDLENKITTYKTNLLSLNGIGIDYDTNDFGVWKGGAEYFSELLDAENIDHFMYKNTYAHRMSTNERIKDHMTPFFSSIFEKATLTPTDTSQPTTTDTSILPSSITTTTFTTGFTDFILIVFTLNLLWTRKKIKNDFNKKNF